MKRFNTFGEYMFDLLFGPLKKGKQAVNQFYIFFKVVGHIFDGMKEDVFRVRDEGNVASASPVMLPVHGQDRDMPRLRGETDEAYRTRLSMKGLIAQWGGTRKGILYALTALGYEKSYIEPVSLHDPEHWAEFIIFLGGKYPSGVDDISIIDTEVRKVKEGSSKPFYGVIEYTILQYMADSKTGFYRVPTCGKYRCGQYPHRNNNVGYLMSSRATLFLAYTEGRFPYHLSGTMRAQTPPYVKADITKGRLIGGITELRTAYHEGTFPYIRSGLERLSEGVDNGLKITSDLNLLPELKGGFTEYSRSGQGRLSEGENNGVGAASGIEPVQGFVSGFASYTRSGQRRAGQRKE